MQCFHETAVDERDALPFCTRFCMRGNNAARAFEIRDGNFYLAGATKDALKATPEFQYNKVQAPPKPKKLTGQ